LADCIGARRVSYKKDAFAIGEGDRVGEFGVLLSGEGRSVHWDESGRGFLVTPLTPGSVFGVLVAANPARGSPVSVQMSQDSQALRIPFERLLTRCERHAHDRLLRNYLRIVAEKGLALHERMQCLLRPTVRARILGYLSQVSREQGKTMFRIPFRRGELALYLNVERSALCRELSRMKRDGLIDYHLGTFKLL
jgi:CRP-like cAMP-binding protein